MVTEADYRELAADFDRIATALTEAKGHAASVGIELPQIVHYAYPVLLALPSTLRQAAAVHAQEPLRARTLPAWAERADEDPDREASDG